MMVPFLLLIAALASQPPTPNAGDTKGEPQPQQGQPTQTQTVLPERGTDANPLIVLTKPSDRQSAEDQQDRKDQRKNRWAAFGLSAITVIVVGFQVWLLIRQNDIMREQSEIMAAQQEAAASSARAATETVQLTERQQEILEQQHGAISEQATDMAQGLQIERDTASAALKIGGLYV